MSLDPAWPPGFQTLIDLVQHYSPTDAESAAVAWLVERMRGLGFTRVSSDEVGNAVGVMGDGERQVVLLGHIDTVPGEIPVRLEGEALYGRGTVDAKGPLAAFVDAVADVGAIEGWQWVVIGAVDEEGDSRGAHHIVDRYRPEAVIVGEPSRWDRVTLGYKGSAWTSVTVRRPMAHSALPGQSACEAAVAFWQALLQHTAAINQDRQRAFDQIAPSLRGWSSGEDGFETWATLRLGARLPPGVAPEDWLAQLRQIDPQAEVEADGVAVAAYRGEKNTPLTRAFLRSIRALGGEPAFVLKTGTADLNLVAPRWGCPALAYGPGDSTLDHTPHEHVLLAEYTRARQVLAGVLRFLAGRVSCPRMA